jgi:hypothetical protein
MTARQPSQASQGAQAVGALLKSWPAKDAPLLVQIAFYEELQRTVEPFASGKGREANWFTQLDRALSNNLVVLDRLASQVLRESKKANSRLNNAVNKVPAALRRVLRQARS